MSRNIFNNVIKNSQLFPKVLEIFMIVKELKGTLLLAGGAVRDMILGQEPKDIDLVTDIPISLLGEELRMNNWDIKTTGQTFQVLFVKKGGFNFEIANFRSDKNNGDGRKNTIAKTIDISQIELDAQRRDLTINALFWDLEKSQIIDFVGGVDDIKNKVIRFVGNPQQRIKEDWVRCFRLFRFAKKLGFKIDKNSLNIAMELLPIAIQNTNKERINLELKKARVKTLEELIF